MTATRPPIHPAEAVGAEFSEQRFRKLVQKSSDITVVIDARTVIRWTSPAVETVLGYQPDEVIGLLATDMVHPDDVGLAVERMASILDGRTFRDSLTARIRAADGRWRHVGIAAVDLTADPDVGGLLLNIRDISRRVAALRESDRLGRILAATTDLVGIWEEGSLSYLNAAAKQFLGDADGAPARRAVTDRVPGWVVRTWTDEIRPTLLASGVWSGELAARDLAGRLVPFSMVMLGATDESGHLSEVSGIARDMSERAEFESRLEHQATHDPLTGLPNRTLLHDRLGVALGRARRTRRPLAVLFLDLDHFKIVNDSLGHTSGDRLLSTIAARITKALRPGDTVARFGGDEFVILCEELVDDQEAGAIAARVLATIDQPVTIDDTEVFVSASIGIALADGTVQQPEELVRDADAAMYEAKSRGRSRTEVFDRQMRTRAIDRLALENALRRAIERDELLVEYQPLFAVADGQPIGFEALLRWQHADRGRLLPGEFLPLSEETRLIGPIGNWMARQACGVLARAQQDRALHSPDAPPLCLAVNLSARQLADPMLPDEFASIFADTGVDPATVTLEITESVLMEDVEDSQHELARLKALGVLIAVDDFGTGYSSFAYLRRFPVDVLKVDRSFIDGLGTDPGDSAIVTAVVDLAHTLGMLAVAEGVETVEQLDELRRLGCDQAQGFLLGRPMDERALLGALRPQPA